MQCSEIRSFKGHSGVHQKENFSNNLAQIRHLGQRLQNGNITARLAGNFMVMTIGERTKDKRIQSRFILERIAGFILRGKSRIFFLICVITVFFESLRRGGNSVDLAVGSDRRAFTFRFF